MTKLAGIRSKALVYKAGMAAFSLL
jgi:hypothetical protein